MNNIMQGKKGLIMGVTNEFSIAWGISKTLRTQGAKLAFTAFPIEKILNKVSTLAATLDSNFVYACDVTKSDAINRTFKQIKTDLGSIDFLVHAIAFADKNELRGRFIDTSLPNFLNSLHTSCYSFIEAAKYASSLMPKGGNLLTLTYLGANKVVPNYNIMGVAKAALEASVRYTAEDLGKLGIRVNALSAGPIKTLAASGISDFSSLLKWNEENAPLRRNINQTDIAGSSLYLLSDLSSGVTGEIHYVDSGYNIIGIRNIDNIKNEL